MAIHLASPNNLGKAMDMESNLSSSHLKRWWSKETVVVVTGANKGIGFSLVEAFAKLGLTVVLTSRDLGKGKAALDTLADRGLRVEFCLLDVTDPSSIAAFTSWLQQSFGGLDILVNNAGVSFNEIESNSVEHAETVIRTNFYGPKMLTEALLPLFRRSASISRILNISSLLGLLNKVSNPSVKALLADEETLSAAGIEQMVAQFLRHVKIGSWEDEGWPKIWTDYSVSKLALNAYSRLLAKQHEGNRLSVNCFCPGFTRTAMTGGQGCRSPEEAADIGAKIALLPPNLIPTGKFFKLSTPTLYSKL